MQRRRFLLLPLLALTLAGAAPAQAAPTGLSDGEGIIWYLGHCGYAIQTRNHLLIFDYQEKQDGQAPKPRPENPSLEAGFVVPEQIRDRRVRVFVTHSHADHFDPVIFEWKERIPDIAYYFGWQASEDPSFHYLIGPRAELESGDLEIFTVNSHHSGVPEVAYLVRVDGLVIYHNGDYMAEFEKDYPFLKTKAGRIDLAFTPPVIDEKMHYGRQSMALVKTFQPNLVFPMHMAAGSRIYTEFEETYRTRFPGLSIALPRKIGDRFVYRSGKLVTE